MEPSETEAHFAFFEQKYEIPGYEHQRGASRYPRNFANHGSNHFPRGERMRRALVIDDSRTIRSILGKKVAQLGFKVSDAENGKVGLDVLRANPGISLVLVDWNMPVMNGLQFVQAVRAEEAWNDVMIVMVTTETETSQMLAALDAGANDYIMKPFTEEIITERLMLLGIQEQTV